jgi:hypothetical protein
MSPTRQLPGSYPGAAPSESGPGARFELFELPFSDKNWRESVAALAAIQGLNEKVEEQKAGVKAAGREDCSARRPVGEAGRVAFLRRIQALKRLIMGPIYILIMVPQIPISVTPDLSTCV